MKWLHAPARNNAPLSSSLSSSDVHLASSIVKSFSHDHRVSVVKLHPSALHGRDLRAIIEMTPELTHFYAQLTRHKTKSVVLVQDDIQYTTPYRQGQIRIKGPDERSWCPHVGFCSRAERELFRSCGSATLGIIIKQGGAFNGMEECVLDLGRAISTERLESLLIVTDSKTPQNDWNIVHRLVRQKRVSVGYTEIGGPNRY